MESLGPPPRQCILLVVGRDKKARTAFAQSILQPLDYPHYFEEKEGQEKNEKAVNGHLRDLQYVHAFKALYCTVHQSILHELRLIKQDLYNQTPFCAIFSIALEYSTPMTSFDATFFLDEDALTDGEPGTYRVIPYNLADLDYLRAPDFEAVKTERHRILEGMTHQAFIRDLVSIMNAYLDPWPEFAWDVIRHRGPKGSWIYFCR